jgi:hypothetical protein
MFLQCPCGFALGDAMLQFRHSRRRTEVSRLSSHGSTLVLATQNGYWIARKCLYERTAVIHEIRIVALSASDAELGREVFQAIRDMAPCDPDKIDAVLDQFARDYPEPDKWLERYDCVSVAYRPKFDARNLEMSAIPAGKAAAAGTQEREESLLPASSGDAEIGAHIMLMLEKVRPQSRPISEKRSSSARGKPKN